MGSCPDTDIDPVLVCILCYSYVSFFTVLQMSTAVLNCSSHKHLVTNLLVYNEQLRRIHSNVSSHFNIHLIAVTLSQKTAKRRRRKLNSN